MLKKKHHFADKDPYSQSGGFSSSHVQMWELNYKEGWAPKNWCFWTVMQKKTFESPLDSKEIKPVFPKGIQPWIFIGRTDVEAPLHWLPDMKNRFIGKDSDVGKDWSRRTRGRQDEMAGWHHQLNGYEFEQTPGAGNGQGGLVYCRPWGCKESHTTELNCTDISMKLI